MIIINRNTAECSFHYEPELSSCHYLTIGDIVTVKLLSVKEDLADIDILRGVILSDDGEDFLLTRPDLGSVKGRTAEDEFTVGRINRIETHS